jgi:hypothetical protein
MGHTWNYCHIAMRINGDDDIRLFIQAHGSFSEWIINQIKLSDYGTTLEVTLTGNWTHDPTITEVKSPRPTHISLIFRLVQEFRVNNALNVAMLNNPESLNWGLNEISALRIVEENPMFWPKPYEHKRFSHVTFLWEGQRKIDVVFSTLDVVIQNE